jgi:acetyl/propionyl-CoA carboxylase alpha subunit
MPAGPGIRVDTHIEAGDRIPAEYDNLIAKLMVHAPDRDAAIDRLRRALDETEIGGIQTTLPFHRAVARSAAFRAARLSTGWVDEHWGGPTARAEAARRALLAAGLDAVTQPPTSTGLASPPPASGTTASAAAAGGRWRGAGRAGGVDRWPG